MIDNRQLDRVALDRELVKRGGLRTFVELAWPQIEATPLVGNWHIDLLSDILGATFDRDIRKLIINEPPGCMKSRMVSVFYPAWVWSLDPSESFLYASFDQGLSDRDSRDMRQIVISDWFQQRWPACRMPRGAVRQVRDFRNSVGGWRFSTSVGGKGTGRHPHERIIDDPSKPADVMGTGDPTRRALEAVVLWYQNTIATRQADPVNTIDILMMQRLSDLDLAGVLAAEWKNDPKFAWVVLPMRYDPERTFSFSFDRAP